MEREVGDVPGFALSYDGRELDNFWPGAEDEGEHALWGISSGNN